MVPSGLQVIFSALAVGVFSLLLLSVFAWLISRNASPFVRWVYSHRNRPRAAIGSLVLVLFAYGCGVIVEDITDQLTDTNADYEDKPWYFIVQKLQVGILGKEGDHRFRSLFKEEQSPTGEQVYKLNPLGRGIYDLSEYMRQTIKPESSADYFFLDDYENVDRFLNHENVSELPGVSRGVRRKLAARYANMLYYPAKNWAYMQPGYFDEMERIQRRIDFSRSCFLLASWALAGLLVLAPFSLLVARLGWLRPGKADNGGAGRARPHQTWRLLKFAVMLLIVCELSREGYRHAENIFNERAYGYHLSHLERTQRANRLGNETLTAILWTHASAEYAAVCRTIYAAAFSSIQSSVQDAFDSTEEGMRPVVVMDLDETVIDNTMFNLALAGRHLPFSSSEWGRWLAGSQDDVRLVPGAGDFIRKLHSMDIDIIFLSNRPLAQVDATLQALENLEFDDSFLNNYRNPELRAKYLLLKKTPDQRSKQARRQSIIEPDAATNSTMKVLAYIGDDLADFHQRFEPAQTGNYVERRALVAGESFVKNWGTLWFA